MIKVYVETDSNLDRVLNVSTVNQGSTDKEALFDETSLDLSKMAGFRLLRKEDVYHVIYDEKIYETYLKEKEKEEAIKAGEELKRHLTEDTILQSASDEDAYVMRYLYDEWTPNTDYTKDVRVLYVDNLYKCIQTHTSEEGPNRTPDVLPALWTIVNGDSNKGTKDNPIIIPDSLSSMEYVKGSYYLENETLYLMNREGMNDGETITLTFKPSQLVGHYFKTVE